MKVIGEFKNEHGETFKIGFKRNNFYFISDDWLFGERRWRKIELGRFIFSNEELLAINNIIRKMLISP